MGLKRTMQVLLVSSMLLCGMADREQSVAAGREALDRWVWQYPWYDAEKDGVRSVEVSEPSHERESSLFDWLENLFSFGTGSMSWLQWLIWSGIAVLLALMVYLLVRTYWLRERKPSESAGKARSSEVGDEKRRIEALPAAAARKRSGLLAEARRHYREGNYGEAIIFLFSHQLVQLDKHRLVRLSKGKTNRQYLRELRPRPTLRELLTQTMVAFEDVFFGNRSIDRPRFESVWLRLDEFDRLVTGSGQ